MLNGPGLHRLDGPQAVDGVAQGVHRPAQQGLAHGHVGRPAGALNPGALVQAGFAAQQHHAHTVPLQVQHNPPGAGLKLHQFSVHRPL